MDGGPELVHGTAIAIGRVAALIRGPSGAGKSDLALRCLATGRSDLIQQSAQLVSDDQVLLKKRGSVIEASVPASIQGKLEVRGIGIIEVNYVSPACLAMVIELSNNGLYERLPEPKTVELLGVEIPVLNLDPFEVSAPVKLLVALQACATPPLPASVG